MTKAASCESALANRWPCLGFQLKHIGDFLMTLPALGFLKSRCPDQPVGLVVAPGVAELARAHPWVDEVFVLDKKAGLAAQAAVIAAIGRSPFRSALIFDGQTRSIAAAALAGLSPRLGAGGLYALGPWRFLYTADFDIRKNEGWAGASQAQRGVMLAAAAAGVDYEPGLCRRPPGFELGPENKAAAEKLISELAGDGPLVGLTLEGLQPEKSWPLANFAKLCRLLRAEFAARLFVTGGPGESAAARALAEASGGPVGDFCGRTTLLDLAALTDLSDLFITIDTGTSHLAALTETPVISIFIWTSPALWPPGSPSARVLCYDWSLARFGLSRENSAFRPAPVVTPEMVFKEAAELLGRRKPGGRS